MAKTNVATRSRTVWLQMKTLTVLLAECFFTRRPTSIAKLAMKPEIQMTNMNDIMRVSGDLKCTAVIRSSEVVPFGPSLMYVVSSCDGRAVTETM